MNRASQLAYHEGRRERVSIGVAAVGNHLWVAVGTRAGIFRIKRSGVGLDREEFDRHGDWQKAEGLYISPEGEIAHIGQALAKPRPVDEGADGRKEPEPDIGVVIVNKDDEYTGLMEYRWDADGALQLLRLTALAPQWPEPDAVTPDAARAIAGLIDAISELRKVHQQEQKQGEHDNDNDNRQLGGRSLQDNLER